MLPPAAGSAKHLFWTFIVSAALYDFNDSFLRIVCTTIKAATISRFTTENEFFCVCVLNERSTFVELFFPLFGHRGKDTICTFFFGPRGVHNFLIKDIFIPNLTIYAAVFWATVDGLLNFIATAGRVRTSRSRRI